MLRAKGQVEVQGSTPRGQGSRARSSPRSRRSLDGALDAKLWIPKQPRRIQKTERHQRLHAGVARRVRTWPQKRGSEVTTVPNVRASLPKPRALSP